MAPKGRARRKPVTVAQMPAGMIPTPEAMRRSEYELVRIEQNGPKVAVNKRPTPLAAALERHAITPRQYEAGRRFEAVHIIAWGHGSPRNTLDMTVRGNGVETESQAERVIRANDVLDAIRRRMDAETYWRLVDICVLGLPIGDSRASYLGYVRLIRGLNIVADYYILPEGD